MRFICALGLLLPFSAAANSQVQQPVPPKPLSQPQINPQAPVFPTPIYRIDGVNKNLNLTQQQIDRLNDMTNKVQTTYRDRYGKISAEPENVRAARLQEFNQQYTNDWMTGAKEVFNENQFNRYRQLQYQHGGYNTFNDADVQKRLNLTEDQRRRLRDEIEWNTTQTRTFSEQTDREKAQQLYRDYRKQYDERFNKFLTPDQQKAWRELAGEPYEFQPNFSPQR